ncbi:hypothetical protein ACVWWN_002348 [Mycobacterium sp. URHB0021]
MEDNGLVHCHNKMVIIDGAAVLVSSQNWSDFAVTKNREAGLWLPHRDIAQYFQGIFDVDRRTAFRRPEEMFGDEDVSREALGKGASSGWSEPTMTKCDGDPDGRDRTPLQPQSSALG